MWRNFLKRILLSFFIFAFLVSGASLPRQASAQNITFISDAEVESIIRLFSAPLFEAAGLDPTAVEIYIIKNKDLNAFVAGGQKLFLNTGLLIRARHAGEVMGVVAHETGHIAGGHLSRTNAAIERSSAQSIAAIVLGAATAVLSGRPDVGQAIMLGGQGIGARTFFRYSRTQESAADQAALSILSSLGLSSRGLVEFLELIEDQEQLGPQYQDPYLLTHPLTRDRIEAARAYLARSPLANAPLPKGYQALHERMRAKLAAFLEPPSRTLRRYAPADKSLVARYARAIAYYRRPEFQKAMALINGLIAEHPSDPYFHELKGQILFENGRAAEAVVAYQAAAQLLPTSPLILTQLATVQLETNNRALIEPAIRNLRTSVQAKPNVPTTWRQLAIAYGRTGQRGLTHLALAEEALLQDKTDVADRQAGRAARLLPKGSPDWLRSQDVLQAAKDAKANKR